MRLFAVTPQIPAVVNIQSPNAVGGVRPKNYNIFLTRLNSLKVKGISTKLGDIFKPLLNTCATHPNVVNSSNPEKQFRDCVVTILDIARMNLGEL